MLWGACASFCTSCKMMQLVLIKLLLLFQLGQSIVETPDSYIFFGNHQSTGSLVETATVFVVCFVNGIYMCCSFCMVNHNELKNSRTKDVLTNNKEDVKKDNELHFSNPSLNI
jgi:uridine phosphorylase